MDDVWKYNGDTDGVKRTQYTSVSTSVQKSDPSQLASSSLSERETSMSGEDVMRLPSLVPSFSSLSQDQAATSNATLSSASGPDLMSELGEGRSSPQTEVSRSKVSVERCLTTHPQKHKYLNWNPYFWPMFVRGIVGDMGRLCGIWGLHFILNGSRRK